MKLYICGHGRHGKDTVAVMLAEICGATFESSSWFCCERFIYPRLRDWYCSPQECFDDRHNHRAEWHELIRDFNGSDPARLSREIFAEHDIYVGIRSLTEMRAAMDEGLADLAIWVDATDRLGFIESAESNELSAEDCDIVLLNNGTELQLRNKLQNFSRLLVFSAERRSLS